MAAVQLPPSSVAISPPAPHTKGMAAKMLPPWIGKGIQSELCSSSVVIMDSRSSQLSGCSLTPASSSISPLARMERTPAYQGMPYMRPSRVPASARPSISPSARPSASMSSVRSSMPPASANSGTQVVPTSATSGPDPPAMAVTNLSWAPSQGWTWTSRVAPVCSVKASLSAVTYSLVLALVPSISHMVMVLPSPSTSPPPSSPPQADRARAAEPAAPAARTWRRAIMMTPSSVLGRGRGSRDPTGEKTSLHCLTVLKLSPTEPDSTPRGHRCRTVIPRPRPARDGRGGAATVGGGGDHALAQAAILCRAWSTTAGRTARRRTPGGAAAARSALEQLLERGGVQRGLCGVEVLDRQRAVTEVVDRKPLAAVAHRLVGDHAGQGVAGGLPGVDGGLHAVDHGAGEVVDQEVVGALVAVGQPLELLGQPLLMVGRGGPGDERLP